MAGTVRRTGGRTGRNLSGGSRGAYVEGSAVRKLQETPGRQRPPARRSTGTAAASAKARPQHHQTSRRALRNREKALSMNKSFVIFLAIVSVSILMFTIRFLQLKSEITASTKEIAALESELSSLKEDNDAYYSQVNSSIDLSRIKKIAVGRLGMKAPTKEQIRTYQTSRSSYIRQYQDIPGTD